MDDFSPEAELQNNRETHAKLGDGYTKCQGEMSDGKCLEWASAEQVLINEERGVHVF